jgi:hypothetical protein
MINFKDWFWGKFEEWRKGTTNGPTAYARYLNIKQQAVSSWLDGKYIPKSQQNIYKLGLKYPEIYDLFGFSRSDGEEVSFEQWPSDLRQRLLSADREIRERFTEYAITDPESPEALQVVIDVMEQHGFRYTDTR